MGSAKSIFASKTFWFNFLTGVASVGGELVGVLPPQISVYTLPVMAIVNIILRGLTSKPVELFPK